MSEIKIVVNGSMTLLEKIINSIKQIEDKRPKTFLLFHVDDFFKHKDDLGIIQNQLTGLWYYNEIRIHYSLFAEKGMIRELPIRIIEPLKVNYKGYL